MLRELLISSPLIIAGAFAFYYFNNYNSSHSVSTSSTTRESPRHTEAEQDELIQRILSDMQTELRDTYNGEESEEEEFEDDELIDDERQEEEPEGFNPAELPEDFRRRINPTPAQLAAANAANTATSSGSSRGNRTVGTKKSKSLAKKDRIRAYNEYMRQQSELERLRQQEYDEQYGDLIAEAKKEREQREASAEALIQQRRIEKKEKEEQVKQELSNIKDKLQEALKTNGSIKLENDTEKSIASEIKEGIVVANGTYLVLIDNKLETKIASSIKNSGRISFSELASNM